MLLRANLRSLVSTVLERLIIRAAEFIVLVELLTSCRGSLVGRLKKVAQHPFCRRQRRDHQASGLE